MARAVLEQIQKAEEQAQSLMRDTKNKADQMISSTLADVKQRYEALQEKYYREGSIMRDNAMQTGKANSESFNEQTLKMGEALKQELLLRHDEAVDMVIQILTE